MPTVMREESVLARTGHATNWLLEVRQSYFDLQANERQPKTVQSSIADTGILTRS